MCTTTAGAPQAASLEDHFWRQSALNRSLSRWQGQWLLPAPLQRLSLGDCGLALTISRSLQGQYLATLLHAEGGSLDSGHCASPIEACLLVLGLLNPEKWYQR
jgi:hypothetical protein